MGEYLPDEANKVTIFFGQETIASNRVDVNCGRKE